jgi:hypothetical protein
MCLFLSNSFQVMHFGQKFCCVLKEWQSEVCHVRQLFFGVEGAVLGFELRVCACQEEVLLLEPHLQLFLL